MLKALILASLAFSTCHQTGVVAPTGGCQQGATTCIDNRPYACGSNAWRPIGDFACPALGVGIICCPAPSGVHACLPRAYCGGITQ